ncbi:MAG: prepilin-type N-terminal cleavage/methylation domain-containing protein [Planctomycetes bacterium]|nr:prepilin-type N-terminal cleavage/methylation domain-containing protein [Planctomycetota bacterium]MBI3835227.1 prepilin-type N-terminal cleavage/methylation domain-containing protein [Planctomycetota bacterium]
MQLEACKSTKRLRKWTGFTLIELLVVIAIIALLIAILLPSLEAARRTAKQNACLSHIKNIGTSSRVYEADDTSGYGIPVHPLQFVQDASAPTFIGAYEWGGKAGIGGKLDEPANLYDSNFGTKRGFGPSTRPLNNIMYKGGFTNHSPTALPLVGGDGNREGQLADTKLMLEIFTCPADNGPPRGAHCPNWIRHTERSSYDHFGNSFVANVFMIAAGGGGGPMYSNSPYMRPITRVPSPARTLYYEENIGRWAWSCKNELKACEGIVGGAGVDPGPTKAIRGWHGKDWTFDRVFVDSHAEQQKIWLEGTEDNNGYANHYRNERLDSYPGLGEGDEGSFDSDMCIIVRGTGWQKDTMPAPLLDTHLNSPGGGRPSYEGCVVNGG